MTLIDGSYLALVFQFPDESSTLIADASPRTLEKIALIFIICILGGYWCAFCRDRSSTDCCHLYIQSMMEHGSKIVEEEGEEVYLNE
jgi:hypothetical protein